MLPLYSTTTHRLKYNTDPKTRLVSLIKIQGPCFVVGSDKYMGCIVIDWVSN
jgi:hypothetical protein